MDKEKKVSALEEVVNKQPAPVAEEGAGEFIGASDKGSEGSSEPSKPTKEATSKDALITQLIKQNKELQASLEATKNKSANDELTASMAKLVDIMAKKENPKDKIVDSNNTAVTSENYKNVVEKVDGRSLIHNQTTLKGFKDEPTVPISVPRSMKDYVGPSLDVTVNGVRVSVPCDGKTYNINKTHYQHIRERMAKIEVLNSKSGEDVKTIA